MLAMIPNVTFTEVVAAWQSRLGQRVRVTTEERGRVRRTAEGVLKPGIPDAIEVVPDEHGRVAFMIVGPGPNTYGFLLDPRIVKTGQEQHDGREVRVEMYGGVAFVIQTLKRS
jgi:hypothetical protein